MSGEGNAVAKGKKRKYLPHGRPVKKGAYPLRPGVQGFFLTCDGGRERQATNEAINLLDSFYEEMVFKKDSEDGSGGNIAKPMNKKITFKDSDSDSDSSGDDGEQEVKEEEAPTNVESSEEKDEIAEKKSEEIGDEIVGEKIVEKKNEENGNEIAGEEIAEKKSEENGEQIAEEQTKKQKIENTTTTNDDNKNKYISEEKTIDELINEELKQMGDKKKRKFLGLDTTCNGVIFIQMQKKDGDPNPAEIVQYIMNSAFSTRKHMSRFILRMIPTEIVCYASEEEITRAIKPLVDKYFPEDSSTPKKFAVIYASRANTGIDRMKIINAVAKSIPSPHKVDLKNPDKTIIVEIIKTNCLVGVVEKYKELSKFNIRQLTSPQE
ncbi:hypothetical protein LUZ60_009205 [Juncus effusus]|nr:hypothetical protein LUZ60_009205 [Juncus effusus]